MGRPSQHQKGSILVAFGYGLVVGLFEEVWEYIPSLFSGLSSQLLELFFECSRRKLKWFYGSNIVHENMGIYLLHE